jgi:hypothetical protein
MFQRSFLFVMMVISFTGCAGIHKTQTQNIVPVSVSNQEKLSLNDEEKVWVEAETKKVWVNDHVDESGDMVEGHYKHIIVTPGHWAVKDGGRK